MRKYAIALALISGCDDDERKTDGASGIYIPPESSSSSGGSDSSSSSGDAPIEPFQMCDATTECHCEGHTCVTPCDYDSDCIGVMMSCIDHACWRDCSAADLFCDSLSPPGEDGAVWQCSILGQGPTRVCQWFPSPN